MSPHLVSVTQLIFFATWVFMSGTIRFWPRVKWGDLLNTVKSKLLQDNYAVKPLFTELDYIIHLYNYRLRIGKVVIPILTISFFTQTTFAVDIIFDLGRIVGGGDGRGQQLPGNENKDAIDVSTGDFVSGINFGHTYYSGYKSFSNSPFIDGVFILGGSQITSTGVQYSLQTGDGFHASFDYITNNREPGGSGNLHINSQIYNSGIGIHAGSGITFDVDTFRSTVGSGDITFTSKFFNMGLNTKARGYVVLSDTNSARFEYYSPLLDAAMNINTFDFSISIPHEIKFLTLMVGVGGDGIDSDHGGFADSFLIVTVPEPSSLYLVGISFICIIAITKLRKFHYTMFCFT
jgi:hypothetical protein